jgi:hypothetical protein
LQSFLDQSAGSKLTGVSVIESKKRIGHGSTSLV